MKSSQVRHIVLDTETTGLNPDEGHRVIEIGCIEIVNRKITGSRFHVYLNPDREIDPGAVEVHGLSSAFLADKPRFEDVKSDFLAFVQGADLVIHNAPFDVGFLNAELARGEAEQQISDFCSVTDTLVMARKKHAGQRNTLDALCKRYDVDNRHRELHGALLDAELLAEVFLAMTGGQSSLALDLNVEASVDQIPDLAVISTVRRDYPSLAVVYASAEELERHHARVTALNKASGGKLSWEAPVVSS
jgi:DNA polymerase-3 subunit epsilon